MDNDFGFQTDGDIKRRQKTDKPLFRVKEPDDFDENLAEEASYNLRLGNEVYISGKDYPDRPTEEEPFVTIPRGQFALLLTKEYVTMPPDYLGLISIRLSLKGKGLVNISGFHVDPGFEGKLYFSVFNAGPADIVLRYNKPSFIIFFYKLHKAVERHRPAPKPGETIEQLPIDLVTSLKGSSASLSDLDKRVGHLENTARFFAALLIAIAVGIILLSLR